MPPELILCIPGPWKDRRELIQKTVLAEPVAQFVFAGMLLADLKAKEHVVINFGSADSGMAEAFKAAGQSKILSETLDQILEHESVVYLHFPLDLPGQRKHIVKFTRLLQQLGGMAVKVESAGIAHSWERWFALLSGTDFDLYCSGVVLVGDGAHYYSCGMHHFGFPECEISTSFPASAAADLMNRFNFWQIAERPQLAPGHTFSLTADSPHFRLSLAPDVRHDPKDLFHNPQGVWRLNPI